MSTRRELLCNLREQYSVASKRKKQQLLDGLIDATGYNRKYAISLLNKDPDVTPGKRKRKRIYDDRVAAALKEIWIAANGICPKRFMPFLPKLLHSMERFGRIRVDPTVRHKLLKMSPSTADRLLRVERREGQGRSLTKPGSLLNKQIAIKIFSPWNENKLGFFEIDLVAHCGDDISGRFLHTLTMTDIATGWTELHAVQRKTEDIVRGAIEEALLVLPFGVKGLDTDNGSEFRNYGMLSWCNERRITFTRSRAYRKNDQAHVEEKNGSVVRRLVGYDRFEGNAAYRCLTKLYQVARLYVNYFQPSMKLLSRTRDGARVIKRYDVARTPLERLLKFRSLPKRTKKKLQSQFSRLDPIALLIEMASLQKRLWKLAVAQNGHQLPRTVIRMDSMTKRAKRKNKVYARPKHTVMAKITSAIRSLPYGSLIQADDFLKFGTGHTVNVALHMLCVRDRLIARVAWGKYEKIDPRKPIEIENVKRKLRNKKK